MSHGPGAIRRGPGRPGRPRGAWLPRPGGFAPALLAAVLLAACDDGSPTVADGVVQGIVLVDGVGIPDVTVELAGNEVRTTTTNEDGRYHFDEVPAGSYVVSIRDAPSDASFQATSRTATLGRAQTVNVDFTGNFIRTASISGVVQDREAGLPGVTVVLTGDENAHAETSSEGEFAFTGLRAGEYRVEISGYPERLAFSSTASDVSLETGESRFLTFEGEPELTASLVIREITRREPDGTLVSVDPGALHGTLDVALGLDPGDDTPERVELTVDDEVVGAQEFGADDPDGDTATEAAVQEIRFTVNTAAFDAATGAPRFTNGPRLLRARLATKEGGENAWTSSMQVTFQNADTITGSVRADEESVGEDGAEWLHGAVEVTVIPVVFSPDRVLDSLRVEIVRSGGPVQAGRTEPAGQQPGPVTVVFPDEDDGSEGTVAGYRTPDGEVDDVRVRWGMFDDGEVMEGAPFPLEEGIRIDNEETDDG